jgi:LysM repeat protein
MVTLRRMVQAKHITAIVAAVLIVACLATRSEAQQVRGRAYLFYGLISAIDWGMDELAQRINRSGVAATTNSHMSWRSVADQAISDYHRDPKPIAVVGHSIGGDSAVSFAEALGAAHVPVSLLITYDPTRATDKVPANVERYINLFQSSNVLGGGDPGPARGFHGHYATYNLKDRSEIIHVNLDKFSHIQELLAAKIRAMGVRGEGEAVPLRIVFAPAGPIELWDSGTPVSAHAGDTMQSIATAYHVPVWALAQINQKSESAALTEGERIVVPRYLGQRVGPKLAAPEAPKTDSSEALKPDASEAPKPVSTEAPKPDSEAPKPEASDAPNPVSADVPKPVSTDASKPASTDAPAGH